MKQKPFLFLARKRCSRGLLFLIVPIKYSYNAFIVHMNIYNIIMKPFLTYKAQSIFQVTKPGFLKAKTFIKKHG